MTSSCHLFPLLDDSMHAFRSSQSNKDKGNKATNRCKNMTWISSATEKNIGSTENVRTDSEEI